MSEDTSINLCSIDDMAEFYFTVSQVFGHNAPFLDQAYIYPVCLHMSFLHPIDHTDNRRVDKVEGKRG